MIGLTTTGSHGAAQAESKRLDPGGGVCARNQCIKSRDLCWSRRLGVVIREENDDSSFKEMLIRRPIAALLSSISIPVFEMSVVGCLPSRQFPPIERNAYDKSIRRLHSAVWRGE